MCVGGSTALALSNASCSAATACSMRDSMYSVMKINVKVYCVPSNTYLVHLQQIQRRGPLDPLLSLTGCPPRHDL